MSSRDFKTEYETAIDRLAITMNGNRRSDEI